jgi:hypothetical protein
MTRQFLLLLTLLFSLSGPAIGEFSDFGQNINAARGTPHKNSLDYVGETHVYRVKGPDGVKL